MNNDNNFPNKLIVGFAIGMGIAFASLLLILALASASPTSETLFLSLIGIASFVILGYIGLLFYKKLEKVAIGILLAFALPFLLVGWCFSLWQNV